MALALTASSTTGCLRTLPRKSGLCHQLFVVCSGTTLEGQQPTWLTANSPHSGSFNCWQSAHWNSKSKARCTTLVSTCCDRHRDATAAAVFTCNATVDLAQLAASVTQLATR